jgi:ribose transport system permease protein
MSEDSNFVPLDVKRQQALEEGNDRSTGPAPTNDWAGPPQRRQRVRSLLRSQGLLAMLVALALLFKFESSDFLTWPNIVAIGSDSAVLGIMAVAQTYLIIAAGIDVSVGSVVALSCVVLGLTLSHGLNPWLAILATLATGAAVGALNGFIVVRLHLNPLITTLGTMTAFSGLAYILAGNDVLSATQRVFAVIGTGYLLGLPVSLVIFLVLVLVALLIERLTVLGRVIYAIGGNREAARLAGLQVRLVPFCLYVASGTSAGLAAVVVTSQLAAASAQVGSTYLLTVVTAVILGGASLAGGRGSIVGTFIAVLILSSLQNGFALMQMSSFAQDVAIGAALIFAVLLDETVRHSSQARKEQ